DVAHGCFFKTGEEERETKTVFVSRSSSPVFYYCLAAIVCASGRTTAGMMWASTSSWQMRRWLGDDSADGGNVCRPQYWRTVKYTLIGASGKLPVRTWYALVRVSMLSRDCSRQLSSSASISDGS